jgi:hypoxanthine phosphoribosyltransferase
MSMLLKSNIKSKLNQYDWYVAISRGGLPVAGYLSYITGQRQIDTINVWSYDDQMQGKIQFIDKDLSHLADQRVLLIDDIADHGATLEFVHNQLSQYGPKQLDSFTIYYKPHSIFTPTYYLNEIPNETWVEFTWDNPEIDLLNICTLKLK